MDWVSPAGAALRIDRRGSGPLSVVLLHELGGSLESFDAILPLLEDRFDVLRYDQRGAGLSEKPPAGFGMDEHVVDLLALLHGCPPVLLAGVAAGAAIAVATALARPQAAAGLLLCCPALTVPPDRRTYLQERSALAAREGMRAVAAPSLARSWPEELRADGADFERYRARFLCNDPVGYGHANMALANASLEPRLAELRLPCHILAGRHDRLRPPHEVEAIASRIADAQYAVAESGHLLNVQAPAAFAAAVHALADDIGRSRP
jgi:3-oxoadipate enol-lactonase